MSKEINTNISNQLNELSKYESIVDAEDQAKKIIDKANEKSQITQDTAQLILNDAIIDSERIIEEANIKAKQIADSSFEAKVLWIKTITKPLDYNEEICEPLHPKGGSGGAS